ncbi:MAG TPA: TolC family protein [Bryobacteraceae bacterium]|nr:TolC family protein [Bryobacteraceae bacterium]
MRVIRYWLASLCTASLIAQQPGTASVPRNIENSTASPRNETPSSVPRSSWFDFAAPYRRPSLQGLYLGPADRARALVHNGAIYLSLHDALALAIENNLDVEVGRYDLVLAGSDVVRAQGGGTTRGLDYTVAESPTGVGGPGSPLLNSAASTVTPATPTINELTPLNELTQTQTSLSETGTTTYSQGPSIPLFDPALIGQTGYFQRSNTSSLTSVSGVPQTTNPAPLHFVPANLAYLQGFGLGTQFEVDLNNEPQVLFNNASNYDPFSSPNTSVTVTQPLLRGFGRGVNLRFLKISEIDRKISRLILYQQLIATVYGISRLYYDLVSLNENVRVQRQTLTAAQKMYEDESSQVERGTLAPLELTRAQALVSTSELGVIQAEGLVRQQEVILKSQLARRGSADPVLASLPIVTTDAINVPPSDDLRPVDDLVGEAVRTRPDLAQANLQVQTGQLYVKGSENALRPELDLYGNFQTRGSAEAPFETLGTPGTGLANAPLDLASQGLRTSRIYQAGIQLNLPLRNRVAQADAARDLVQLRQSEARTQQLANQVREEVENASIALTTARSALEAAIRTRQYQEQLLDAERDKLSVGASTNLLVIQQEEYLAQARSTEVASRSTWVKARIALDRALGNLLDKNAISFEDAVTGQLPPH